MAVRNAEMPRTGLDVACGAGGGALRGTRTGLVTHAAAVSRDGRPGRLALLDAGVRVERLFTPEHGLESAAAAGQSVRHQRDPLTGLEVISLYGEVRKPRPEMLDGLDVLVYDLQDIGVRTYTYVSTLALVLEAAAEAAIPAWILDRPDPLTGLCAEGIVRRPRFQSFVGHHPIPQRYALTPAELARWSCPGELELHCVPLEGWTRDRWWNADWPWHPPSPAISSPLRALVFAASVVVEATTWSEGRGTEAPFELVGGPGLDAKALVTRLRRRNLPGVHFEPAAFTPKASKHAGRRCTGIRLSIVDADLFRPVVTGVALLEALRDVGGITWTSTGDRPLVDLLHGSDDLRLTLDAGGEVDPLLEAAEREGHAFEEATSSHRLYPPASSCHHV